MNRQRLITVFIAIAIGLIANSCVSKTPLTEVQKNYAGKWVSEDGTYVQIYFDGGGDLKGSNTSIEGGATTITANSLKIGLGPINKEFKISQQPQEKSGKWTMQLDGVKYTKQ